MIKNRINKKFSDLKKYLKLRSITVNSKFLDSELIEDLSSLQNANDKQISFFNDYNLLKYLKSTKAKCCFIKYEHVQFLPNTCTPIIVLDPYLCFAHSSNFFYPKIISNGNISNKSFVHKSVKLSSNVQISDNVYIDEGSIIGKNVIIHKNTIIDKNVLIGEGTVIGNNVTITNAIIGDYCFIDSSTVIGGNGFGFTIDSKIEIVHIGNVIIGNNVNIGSNCSIDRASIDSTIIEDNVRLDNLIQIAHGVTISKDSIIAAQVGIAGSTFIGNNCIIGGQAGIAGHLNIGKNVKIAAKSGVTKNIMDNMTVAGFPAVNIKQWKMNMIKLSKI